MMKNRISLQAVIGLLITGIAVTACGDRATPTPTPIAQGQEEQGPTVHIGSAQLGPDKTMSVCFGQTVALTTKATGRDLTYAWSLDGNGELQRQEGKGDEGSSNRYTAPTTSGEEVVKVAVTDDLKQSATDQVIIQVVKCASPMPTNTLEPTKPKPTDTSTPTFTSTPSEATVVYCTDEGGGGTETIPVEPPRTVAQIRIDLEERATDYGFSLWEVEAYGPDTGNTNLVTGGEAEASTEQDGPGCEGCFSDLAIDGDMNTRWSSEWRDGQWLEIALPDPRVVNRIELKWETAYAQEYCVSVIEPITSPTSTPTNTPTLTPTELPVTNTPTPTDTPTPGPPTPDWCVPFGRPPISNATLQGKAQITFPGDCAEVEYINVFAGTSSDLPEDVHIWVLVYPHNARHYPQSDNAADGLMIQPGDNGNWSITTYLGMPDSGREKFDIVVVLANNEASNFFSERLKAWAAANSWPGLSHGELPNGIMEVQNIVVMRTR